MAPLIERQLAEATLRTMEARFKRAEAALARAKAALPEEQASKRQKPAWSGAAAHLSPWPTPPPAGALCLWGVLASLYRPQL